MRRTIADWGAGALAVLILVFGGFVVIKPAIDHWNDLYRSDPFKVGNTTLTVKHGGSGNAAQRTTTTKEESASFTERVLGNSGLLLVRLILVAIAAFLAAAVLQRAVLGTYVLRPARTRAQATAQRSSHEPTGATRVSEEPSEALATENGHSTPADANGADLASSIGKFVAWRREELGLSQRELGKRAGVSHTVISRLESGQQVPSPRTLERLAEAFRVE
jgi:DNA-binding XRE family transcriptional regulator